MDIHQFLEEYARFWFTKNAPVVDTHRWRDARGYKHYRSTLYLHNFPKGTTEKQIEARMKELLASLGLRMSIYTIFWETNEEDELGDAEVVFGIEQHQWKSRFSKIRLQKRPKGVRLKVWCDFLTRYGFSAHEIIRSV